MYFIKIISQFLKEINRKNLVINQLKLEISKKEGEDMSKVATVAKDNIFYEARVMCQNPNCNNRIGAAELLGINNQRLYFIETNQTDPYAEEVITMSKAYKNEKLITHFCNNICAIGRKFGCEVINKDTSNVYKSSLIFIQSLKEAEKAKDKILEILQDGEITDDELASVQECIVELQKIMSDILNLKLALEKASEVR